MANLADQKSLTASSGVPSGGTAGGGGVQAGAAAGVAATVLLAPLKEMLEAATLQQEVMREMVRGWEELRAGGGKGLCLVGGLHRIVLGSGVAVCRGC